MSLDELTNKLHEGLKWYCDAVKNNWKSFLPATLIAMGFTTGGQALVGEIVDNPSELLTQMTGYWSATLGGYGSFLSLEYYRHKEKYSDGFFSKEMGKTFADVWSADYLSDWISYTPLFIATNHYMLNHGHSEALSGAVTSLVASTGYFFVLCGMYDMTKKVNSYLVKTFKSASKSIKNLFNDGNSAPMS